jgi:hypothetical protein
VNGEPINPILRDTDGGGRMIDLPRTIFTGRPPVNLVPKSTYYLPKSDRELPDDVREWLRCHPIAYDLVGGGRFARCPVCEEWAGDKGCEVRRLTVAGGFEDARRLHDQREWPAQTGRATTKFKGMKPNYQQVTFRYVDVSPGGWDGTVRR